MTPAHPADDRLVQAAITSISFPTTLDAVEEMVEQNEYVGEGMTDLDTLLEFSPSSGTMWSAPRWMTEGDILFFYHTKTARVRATGLHRSAEQSYGSQNRITRVLAHAVQLADLYGGSLFACAGVAGAAEYQAGQPSHFDGRFFAPLADVYIFPSPLPAERLAEYVKIGQGTITPLYGPQFDGVRRLLAEHNNLPGFLHQTRLNLQSFRSVGVTNWRQVACAPEARFIHEVQLRAYLLDYMLDEIKDPGTPLLAECHCLRNAVKTGGISDYFVRVGGRWIPVEAKLNLLAEPNLLAQVARYVNVDEIVPTLGAGRDTRRSVKPSGACLVVDQSGIYLVRDGAYSDCIPGKPIWRREGLRGVTGAQLRDWLLTAAV